MAKGSVQEAIAELGQLRDKHDDAGKGLMALASGKIFPCHALYLAVLNRSLELLDGFTLLMSKGNYGCSMALLRMQLDNVLRFYGALHTTDPHETANAIFNGARLSSLKDEKGKKLRDHYLVELMSKENPWVEYVYDLASASIHLSDQHFVHMLSQSKSVGGGQREIFIGSGGAHIADQHKVELIKAFGTVTRGVFMLLDVWSDLSKHLDPSDLETNYQVYT